MNAKQMVEKMGRTGHIHARGEMTVHVRVVDVKVSYGRVRYEITALAGNGTAWVDEDTITFDEG